MAWFLIIEIVMLILAILFSMFQKTGLAFLAIGIMILVPSALMGCFMISKVYRPMLPYAVYSFEQVRNEKIKCTGYEDGFYVLSNGKKVRSPKSHFFRIICGLSFLVGFMLVFFPTLFVAKKITHKFAPEVYELLKPKPMQVKNPFR